MFQDCPKAVINRVQPRAINDIIVGHITTVDELQIPPSRLVEHGTQDDTIG